MSVTTGEGLMIRNAWTTLYKAVDELDMQYASIFALMFAGLN